MIELRNLTKYYITRNGQRHYVFKNVNLDIPSDKNILVLGNNGQGKSTLLRMLGGVDFPNSGSIKHNLDISWPIGLASGFNGNMTGRENIQFICRIYGLSDKQIKRKLDLVKEFAEIGKFFDMPIRTYSSGMRARLLFGISFLFDFDYYLIDEVFSVGDGHFKVKAKKLFYHRTQKGKIIMVTHNLESAQKWCDIALLVSKCNIKIYNNVEEAVNKYYGNEHDKRILQQDQFNDL